MNITIFGANGRIGQIVTEHALAGGHAVTAYVRRSGSMNVIEKHAESLNIIVGDLTDRFHIERAVRNADVVISTLGPALDRSRKNKGTPIADGHGMIISAMEKLNKKRFITLATPSISADEDRRHAATVVPPLMAKILFPNAFREMKRIELFIKQSRLDWTVVRMINPNARHTHSVYRISLGDEPARMGVSRENVGLFLYSVAVENLYVRKMPIVFEG